MYDIIYPQIENCNDTTIKLTERLIIGTIVGICVNTQDALPSVMIDKFSNIDLHFTFGNSHYKGTTP